MLRIYRTYNSAVKFSKYKFNNKLLGDVTWNNLSLSLSLSIYIYIYKLIVINSYNSYHSDFERILYTLLKFGPSKNE